jgi:hypothetical protein
MWLKEEVPERMRGLSGGVTGGWLACSYGHRGCHTLTHMVACFAHDAAIPQSRKRSPTYHGDL